MLHSFNRIPIRKSWLLSNIPLLIRKTLSNELKKLFKAVQKGSKLRDHYIKLVVMNNIMRAFVVAYKMPAEFQASQEAFLETLVRVESRKNRAWLTSDLIVVQEALHAYETIIESSDEEMIAEMLEFVNYNREQGRWAIMKKK